MGIFQPIQSLLSKDSRKNIKYSYQTKQKNEKGFVVVTLLTTLPLIICLSFAFLGYSHFLLIKTTAVQICRKNLLNGQNQIQNQIRDLLKLNPKAQVLRRKAKKAAKRVRLALNSGNKIALTAALAYAAIVQSQRLLFASKQKLYFLNHKTINQYYLRKIKNDFNQLKINHKLTIAPFPFAVKKVQINNLTPDYKIDSSFSNKQKVTAKWTIKNYNHSLINTFFPTNNLPPITDNCGASIKKGDFHWSTYLIKKEAL